MLAWPRDNGTPSSANLTACSAASSVNPIVLSKTLNLVAASGASFKAFCFAALAESTILVTAGFNAFPATGTATVKPASTAPVIAASCNLSLALGAGISGANKSPRKSAANDPPPAPIPAPAPAPAIIPAGPAGAPATPPTIAPPTPPKTSKNPSANPGNLPG